MFAYHMVSITKTMSIYVLIINPVTAHILHNSNMWSRYLLSFVNYVNLYLKTTQALVGI